MTSFAQRSFAGGEITPALYARCDTVKYTTGLRTCRNMLIMRHGGAASRGGTTFVAQMNSANAVRLIRFVFNASQTYVLEFGDGYMRVYKNGVQLTDSTKTITGITNANPAVVTATAHGFSNGNEVQISGITGAIGSYLNNRNFKVAGVTTNTFQLQYLDGTAVDSTAFGSYGSGGSASRVYQIPTLFASTDLPLIKFTQSADVLTIAHPGYFPQELARLGDTSWTLNYITLGPKIGSPTGLSGAYSSTPGPNYNFDYVVTAVAPDTLEESYPSNGVSYVAAPMPTASNPVDLSWTAATGAIQYNVYRSLNGVFGFLGVANGTTFKDIGASVDLSSTPPFSRSPFTFPVNYPSTVAYYQQRLTFAGSNNSPDTVWCSRSGKFKNFNTSIPTQDDDAITFRLVSKQVNTVKHLIDVGKLLVFTSDGEWAMNGDAAGTLTPIAINPKQYSYNGSSDIAPIVVDNTVLYIQARGSIIRDMSYDFQTDGYKGNDLTIFSSHLVDGYTINDWAYTQIPNSIVWIARSDGSLLGLTYVREQQMLAWHRHDFDGSVENVCSVPEGNEDVLYLTIKRVVNGKTVRYLERMSTRQFKDVIDFNGMDAALTYDGRNTNTGSVMALSGGTAWDSNEVLALVSSAGVFTASDVGSAIFLEDRDAQGNVQGSIRCTITTYTTANLVSVKVNRIVPVGLQNTSTSHWSKAVSRISGLWHLEGKQVSVFADRFVVSSPKNSSYNTLTVANGSITLDQPYAVIRAGLPVTCDLETLDMDSAQVTTLADKKKLITRVTTYLERSRGLWVGARPPENDSVDPLQGLEELQIRAAENYDDPVALATANVDVNIQSEWNSNGRIFIRQVDPIPLTVLAIVPAGLVPVGRG